jgi:hypothetical protein
MNTQMTLIRILFLACVAIGSIPLVGTMKSALAEPLDVRPGLWEMTVHTQGNGQLPFPQEAMSHMSQEQRAAMIAKIEAVANQPSTMVYNSCVTKEDSADIMNSVNDLLSDERSKLKCHGKISKQTNKTVAGTRQCTELGGVQETDNFSFRLADNAHVKGEIDRKINGGEKTMSLKHNFSGKWIGASCGDTP